MSYIIQRSLLFCYLFLPIVALIAILEAMYPVQFFEMTLFFLAMAPWLSWKSRWFLLFPYSRKQLLFLHLCESALLCIITGTSILFLWWLLNKSGHPTSESLLDGALIASVIFSVIRTGFPVNGQIQQNRPLARGPNQFMKMVLSRKGAYLILLYLGILAFNFTPAKKEPILLLIIGLFVLAIVPLAPVSMVVMPRLSYVKWRRACFAIAAVLIFSAITIVLGLVNYGNPKILSTKIALQILGHVPLPLSQIRLLNLAMEPVATFSPLFRKINNDTKKSIPEKAWNNRTAACISSTCLDISDFLIPDDISSDAKSDRFLAIMRLCHPGLLRNTYLRCRLARMNDSRLNKRISELAESKMLNQWLTSDDPLKQFIAIRTFASTPVNKTQEARIKALEDSTDEAVRTAARLHFTFYSPKLKDPKALQNSCTPVTPSQVF
jgi:hypothetical protein